MSQPSTGGLFAGLPVTALGTLASRVLGMVRDMVTAALLGMSGDGVMDAFVVAFRIPNLFRRLFGEGALAVSYLPVMTAKLDQDRASAWRLASVTFAWLAAILVAIVVASEMVLGLIWFLRGDDPHLGLLLGLLAVMLPYLFFICLAAQISATLHATGHFGGPALVPTILNICWLGAAWIAALVWSSDKVSRAYVLAVSILVAGAFQMGMLWPILRSRGFRFDYDWPASREAFWRIIRSLGPMLLGLAITQINTFLDSLMAWGLAAAPEGPRDWEFLGFAGRYPLETGAASAVYYAERLYQFPLGILGVAVATVIFPALSRHAARGDSRRLGEDLTAGLRLVLFLGIPAGAGLVLVSSPLATLLFRRGEFTAADADRVAKMIAWYGAGVWAFCALQVLVRGYYASGDQKTPVKIGLWTMLLNLTLNLALIWPFAEAGLAISTSLSAAFQVLALAHGLAKGPNHVDWRSIGRTAARTTLATAAMAGVGYFLATSRPAANGTGEIALRVALEIGIGMVIFAAVSWSIGRADWGLIRHSSRQSRS